jgi:hypothetical protein
MEAACAATRHLRSAVGHAASMVVEEGHTASENAQLQATLTAALKFLTCAWYPTALHFLRSLYTLYANPVTATPALTVTALAVTPATMVPRMMREIGSAIWRVVGVFLMRRELC